MGSRLLSEPARLAGASLLRLQSDERLADLARAGHEPAFDAIVHRYRAALLRYCGGIVGAGRADDAVQQALINAHAALHRTDDVRHLRSWLHRIAHNASLNMLRAIRDDVPLDELSAGGETPHDVYERAERLRATLAAVADLPERQRAALLLREIEGRSHEEIAAALGTTAGGARQSLARARVAVRHAATVITPYPLLVKLASTMAAGPGGPPVAEAIVGAGAGATIAKLTAGVAATGAIVGGVAGTGFVRSDASVAPKVEQAQTTKQREHRPARWVTAAASSLATASVTPIRTSAATASPIADRTPAAKRRSGSGVATDERQDDDDDERDKRRGSAKGATTTRDGDDDDHGGRRSRDSDDDDHRSASGSGDKRDDSSSSEGRRREGSDHGDDHDSSDSSKDRESPAPTPGTTSSGSSGKDSSNAGSRESDDDSAPSHGTVKAPKQTVATESSTKEKDSSEGAPPPSEQTAAPADDSPHSGSSDDEEDD